MTKSVIGGFQKISKSKKYNYDDEDVYKSKPKKNRKNKRGHNEHNLYDDETYLDNTPLVIN